MRYFEVLSAVFNILLLIWLILDKHKSRKGLIVGFSLSALFVLMQWVIEGIRWQMLFVYLITIVPLCILAVRNISRRKEVYRKSSPLKLGVMWLVVVFYSFLAVALPLILPIVHFDKPSGPYKIGTVTYHWKDEDREEIYRPVSNDKRELMIQIWYPADSKTTGDRALYVSDADVFAEGYASALHMPKMLFTSIGSIKTNALENAAISDQEQTYPLLLFSHSLNGVKNQNTFQVEHLVSHGYIVVGIDHTYNSTVSLFPDGRVVHFVPQESNAIADLDRLNEEWVEDAKFVLNQVEKLAMKDPDYRFTGRIDLNHIGMFGHSFGGATTTQMLMEDSRIKVGMNMDGGLYGKLRVPKEGLNKPFLMMSADDTLSGTKNMSDASIASQGTTRAELNRFFADTFERYEHVAVGGNYWLKINNMKHMGFSDMYMLSPLFEWMEGVNVTKVHRIINAYSLDFFDHYLKQIPSSLLQSNIGNHSEYSLERG